MVKKCEIIDFHTHPFLSDDTNICQHRDSCNMSAESTRRDYAKLGIAKICGSVIKKRDKETTMSWDYIRAVNDEALTLAAMYGDFYVPGFHVHPDFVQQSCDEIEKMAQKGVHLIGELVPYHDGWQDYSCRGFSEILDVAEQYDMVVSFHSMDNDQMDAMVKAHPRVIFVAAHPGEYENWQRHMDRMAMSENYYLDVSGTGLFRHGMLKSAVDLFGAHRFLFGSDYPICNPAMFLGGVRDDFLLTDDEKELILGGNAKRLLHLK